jgi:hypothetical protein
MLFSIYDVTIYVEYPDMLFDKTVFLFYKPNLVTYTDLSVALFTISVLSTDDLPCIDIAPDKNSPD